MSGLSARRVLMPVLALASSGLMLAACAQEPAATSSSAAAATSAAASSAASPAASSAAPSTSAAASAEAALDECSKENLTLVNPGTLTIGTDTPAYPPTSSPTTRRSRTRNPASGQGFESAVAYAVADQLGFATNEVNWTVVPFNSSYAPGDKAFDFDINQISITPKRAKVVDFSVGYYTVNQAVVALKDSPIANATTVAELQGAKLGAQIGTTSLDFINDVVKPAEQLIRLQRHQ